MSPKKDPAAQGQSAKKTTTTRGATLRKLDAQGQPTGAPVPLGDLEFRPDDSGIDLAFDEAFEAAPDPGAEALAQEGAENPQVAPVPAGNIESPQPGATMEFSTSDPAAVATVREATRIPIPTAVVTKWWPAFFRASDAEQPWPMCKVFLTPQGLYVYRSVPEDETWTTGALPTWYAPVDFAKTAKPVTGYAALNAGVPIITTAGKVTVQPSPGCGCAAGRLKRWTPSWVRNTISWEDAVALTGATDATAGR